jgi:hypothetical protein
MGCGADCIFCSPAAQRPASSGLKGSAQARRDKHLSNLASPHMPPRRGRLVVSALKRNICGSAPPSRQRILRACTAWSRFDLPIFPHLIARQAAPRGSGQTHRATSTNRAARSRVSKLSPDCLLSLNSSEILSALCDSSGCSLSTRPYWTR